MTDQTNPAEAVLEACPRIHVGREYASFEAWWTAWCPDRDIPEPSSHIFDAWLARARLSTARPAPVASPIGADVEGMVAPWADYHGDLPDYDHALRCVYESGIQYAVELLAKELGVKDYEPCDGTEEFDGDLGGTLMNIVMAALPKDEHGDPLRPREICERFAARPIPADEPSEAMVRDDVAILRKRDKRGDIIGSVITGLDEIAKYEALGYTLEGPPAALSARPQMADGALIDAAAKAAWKADFIDGEAARGGAAIETFDFDWGWNECATMPLSGLGFVRKWTAIGKAVLALASPARPHVDALVDGEVIIDLDKEWWKSLVEAAGQSKWIPPEYFMNDWVSDCRDFLINGPEAFGPHVDGAGLDERTALVDAIRMAAERLSIEAQVGGREGEEGRLRGKMGAIAADLFRAIRQLSRTDKPEAGV